MFCDMAEQLDWLLGAEPVEHVCWDVMTTGLWRTKRVQGKKGSLQIPWGPQATSLCATCPLAD